MADIKTTVDAMAKKDTSPDQPVPGVSDAEVLSAVKIQTITKELAQPWIYGVFLHRFATKHEVSIEAVREIKDALDAKQVKDNPVAIEEVP